MTRMQRMGPAEWALLLTLSILWGGSFFFFKLLVDAHLPPFTIVLGRVGMAAIALLAFVYVSGRKMPTGFKLTNAAQLACIAAAFIYGCAGIYGRRFPQMGVDPIVTATGQVCGSTIVLLPLAALVDHPWALAPIAIGRYGLGYPCRLKHRSCLRDLFPHPRSCRRHEPLTRDLPRSRQCAVVGRFVLDEHLVWSSLVGMALIFAGLVTIDGRLVAALTKPPTADPMESVRSGKETAAYLCGGEGPRRQ